MLSTEFKDEGVVLHFADGGKELLHYEEYAEICGLDEYGIGVDFFKIIGLKTEAERSKPEPTEEEKARQRRVDIYWQRGHEAAERCRQLNAQRQRTGRGGNLPKYVNSAFDKLSEAGCALGHPRLDSRTRCQLERLFSSDRCKACEALMRQYAQSCTSVPMAEFYAQLAG